MNEFPEPTANAAWLWACELVSAGRFTIKKGVSSASRRGLTKRGGLPAAKQSRLALR